MNGNEAESLAVALARVEGKIDAYASRTSAVEEKVAEIDGRLRLAASDADVNALDERLRVQETRTLVTPAGLAAAMTTAVVVLGGLITFLDRLY